MFFTYKGIVECTSRLWLCISRKCLVNNIKKRNVEKFDYVFITHPHEDHMGGLIEILRNFKVGKIVLPNIAVRKITTKWYNRVMTVLNSGKYDLEIAEKNRIYYFRRIVYQIGV